MYEFLFYRETSLNRVLALQKSDYRAEYINGKDKKVNSVLFINANTNRNLRLSKDLQNGNLSAHVLKKYLNSILLEMEEHTGRLYSTGCH